MTELPFTVLTSVSEGQGGPKNHLSSQLMQTHVLVVLWICTPPRALAVGKHFVCPVPFTHKYHTALVIMRGTQAPHHRSKRKSSIKPWTDNTQTCTAELSKKPKKPRSHCEDSDFTTTICATSKRGASYSVEGIRGIKFRALHSSVNSPDDVELAFFVEWTQG